MRWRVRVEGPAGAVPRVEVFDLEDHDACRVSWRSVSDEIKGRVLSAMARRSCSAVVVACHALDEGCDHE